MNERIAVVDGIRTPFCKSGGIFKDWEADDLGAFVVRELLARIEVPAGEIDELVFGNVLQPPHAANVARVLAVKGGLPIRVPAYTVNRNCASGMEAVASAALKILVGEAEIMIAGGTESMSNFPVLFRKKAREWLRTYSKSKGWKDKLKTVLAFRPSMLVPDMPAIADPLCEMTMGQTAEVLVREFLITREEQDDYAFMSLQRSIKAKQEGRLQEEIVPIPCPPIFAMQTFDDGIREDANREALAKLPPVFDKLTGTVTAGNSSQITDGAAAVLLMRESKAKEMKLSPLGYIREYSWAAIEPSRMGLGPAYAIAKILKKTGLDLKNIDLIEINEAFAAQIIAVERAMVSREFSQKELHSDKPIGEIDRDKLNVNGGAISLGHPIGVSGTRLVFTLLKELRRRNKNLGLATLCVGGGQGQAVVVEVE